MNYSIDISQNTKQKQSLSMFQQQSLQVLSMDVLSVCHLLLSEQESNPILDIPLHILDIACIPDQSTVVYSDELGEANPIYDFTTLKDLLRDQVPSSMQEDPRWIIIEAIINCIDEETGFLCCNADHIKKTLPNLSDSSFEEALTYVHNLEPGGLGTESLAQFLLWQLDRSNSGSPLCRLIICNHLIDLAHGHIRKIAQECNVKMKCVDEVRRLIGSMRPYPAFGYSNQQTHFIIPDAFLSVQGGRVSISVNDSWIQHVSLNPDYLQYLQTTEDPALREYLKEKFDRALHIRSQIEQRGNTMKQLCDYIFSIQKDYFLNDMPLNPLSGASIAQALHISASTVSRCLHNKYICTPKGTFSLSFFVMIGVKSSLAPIKPMNTRISASILALLDQEDPAAPYSDDQIACLLSQQGLSLSRRTIALYREKLGIRNSFLRKS